MVRAYFIFDLSNSTTKSEISASELIGERDVAPW